MHGGLDDIQTLKSRANHLVDGENYIMLNESNFMPSIEFLWRANKDLLEKHND